MGRLLYLEGYVRGDEVIGEQCEGRGVGSRPVFAPLDHGGRPAISLKVDVRFVPADVHLFTAQYNYTLTVSDT